MRAIVVELVMIDSYRHMPSGVVMTSALRNYTDHTLVGLSISTCRGVIIHLKHSDANDNYTSILRYLDAQQIIII